MSQSLIKKISSYFEARKEVVAVYLFGSHAIGKARMMSDVDIAVLIAPAETGHAGALKNTYMLGLARLLRKDIDLVVMNLAGETLLKQIYERGQCILVKDPRQLSVFKMVSFSKIADFGYHKRLMQASVVKSLKQESPIG